MRFGSVCSGIEAATVAWEPLGFEPAWYSEIEPFCCAVLKHHYLDAPNLGDITKITEADLERLGPIDILVGGTPCQSFSVAGLRKGMADPRGNLALRFLQLAGAARPAWVLWENVPGVLSSSEGRDFAAILGGLEELGYGWAYRILDAQYFGVPQRRRRVFVVGYLGDWRRAVSVLFERESLCGHPPPSRETGEGVAHSLARGACGSHGRYDPNGEDYIVARPLAFGKTTNHMDESQQTYVTHSLEIGEMGHLRAGNQGVMGGVPFVPSDMAVRRLLPVECARLMGFPDTYLSQVTYRGKCPPADGPMYRALGNSMCINVMSWLGQRIMEAESQ